MQKILFFIILCLSIGSLLTSCSSSSQNISRWYTPEQISSGQKLFSAHCMGCHGDQGQGAANWQKALPDGSYPPPPLNGSGHAWHHSLSQIEDTIEYGGKHPGATMPGFASVMNETERLAVISTFQNFWDNGTYKAWIKKGGLDR